MNKETKMKSSNEKQMRDQLSIKRHVRFWLLFSTAGLVCGWPFPMPPIFGFHFFSLLEYKATWVVFTATMLLCTVAADSHLWLLQNPGKTQADYYRREHWWLRALVGDFQFGKKKGQS